MLTLALQVRDEQAEAQSVAAVVSAEEAEVAAQAAKCKALKDDALADLVSWHLYKLSLCSRVAADALVDVVAGVHLAAHPRVQNLSEAVCTSLHTVSYSAHMPLHGPAFGWLCKRDSCMPCLWATCEISLADVNMFVLCRLLYFLLLSQLLLPWMPLTKPTSSR